MYKLWEVNNHPIGFTCTDCGHLDILHNNYGICFVGRLASMPGPCCYCSQYNPIDIWMNQLWKEFQQYAS